jgi:hypothetical protein
MKMTNMKWVLVGVPIALVALGTAGVSLASALPLLFVVACPLMMMGMHGGHGSNGKAQEPPKKSSSNLYDH